MIGSFGIGKIGIIVLVLVLLYGGRKLPELGSGFGKAMKNFKKEILGGQDEAKEGAGK